MTKKAETEVAVMSSSELALADSMYEDAGRDRKSVV